MGADESRADAGSWPAVRSFGREALALPTVAIGPRFDLALRTPPVLRLPLAMPPPQVVSLDPVPPRPRVRSHFFARPAAVEPPPAVAPMRQPAEVPERQAEAESPPGQPGTPAPARRARIAPPRDVVKLSERFFYLLQPDLETMLRGGKLGFPRQPFPFQFEGMAFLLPRHSAVLADEMGLGKSMQAISSIRLLVRRGEARRVLVVCPKGLVSNWARELADWAPELLVTAIDGDPERRR